MSIVRVLLPLYGRCKRRLVLALLLAILTVAAGTALLGVSGWFLSGAALAGSLLSFNLFVPSALIRMLSFLRIGSRYAERIVGHALTLRLLADLRTEVFAAVMRQSPARLMQLRQGDAVATLTGDIDTLDSVFLLVFAPLCVALSVGLVFAGVWAVHAPWAGVAVGAATVFGAAALPFAVMHAAYAAGWRAQHAAARTRDELLGVIDGHADLVALDALAPARARYEQACAARRQEQLRLAGAAAAGQAALQLTAGVCVLAVVVAGLHAWQSGALAGPVLAGLVLATLGVFEIAAPIVRGAVKWGAAAGAAQRVQQAMACGPGAPQEDRAAPDADGQLELALRHQLAPPSQARASAEALAWANHGAETAAVVCRAANLSLPGRGTVLDSLDLVIKPGERIALLGASGSGKSTLLHALAGVVRPQAGMVNVCGQDSATWPAHAPYRHVALLSQDAPVFLGTVRTNLLIGCPEADEQALWAALDAARLGDYVRGLPQGLDTWTGEGGWSLSAGQARRLCLARVLLTDARVWLPDEPTAGLDRCNEQAFLAALAACAGGRTVVVATHAALPALAVDRILRLADGKVIEEVTGSSSRLAA